MYVLFTALQNRGFAAHSFVSGEGAHHVLKGGLRLTVYVHDSVGDDECKNSQRMLMKRGETVSTLILIMQGRKWRPSVCWDGIMRFKMHTINSCACRVNTSMAPPTNYCCGGHTDTEWRRTAHSDAAMVFRVIILYRAVKYGPLHKRRGEGMGR